MLTIIAAKASNNVIGIKNQLPWYIPEDLKRFKTLTAGHAVIMGFETFLSILMRLGKPLPGRPHFVLTSKSKLKRKALLEKNLREKFPDFDISILNNQVEFCQSLPKAIKKAEKKDKEIFVIGGKRVFEEALQLSNKLELTEIHKDFEGDAYFSDNFDKTEWEGVSSGLREYEGIKYSFVTYTRCIS